MPDRSAWITWTRRLVIPVVAFVCAAAVLGQERPSGKSKSKGRSPRGRPPASKPVTQPAPEPESQPATVPVDPKLETLAAARQRLARTPPARRSRDDSALLTALEFALAVARADGPRAAAQVDVTGYQMLPLAGDLPERPDRPVARDLIEQYVSGRPPSDIGGLTMDRVEVVPRSRVGALFPALAKWMLAEADVAVVFHPPVSRGPADWLTRDAALVIRIRGQVAVVMGGNLLEALETRERG